MRYVIYGSTCFIITLFFVQMILCVDARNARKDELKQGVYTAMKRTLEAVEEERISSDEEMKALFEQRLAEQISSKSEYTVTFLANKVKEGILSVHVKEIFRYPLGKQGIIAEKQTAVIEKSD